MRSRSLRAGRFWRAHVDRVAAVGRERLVRLVEPLSLHRDHRARDEHAALHAAVCALEGARHALRNLRVAAGGGLARRVEGRRHLAEPKRELRAQIGTQQHNRSMQSTALNLGRTALDRAASAPTQGRGSDRSGGTGRPVARRVALISSRA